jgi:hypothetical protein
MPGHRSLDSARQADGLEVATLVQHREITPRALLATIPAKTQAERSG